MSFCQQISRYYDDIFPPSQAALRFFAELFERSNVVSVLDAACGSGSYVKAFLDRGYQAFGMDLDGAMVEKARAKTQALNIKQGDMLRITNLYSRTFDCLMCIGNSLVHLQDENEIGTVIKAFYRLLNPCGLVVLQIINYDRILDQNIDRLPTIEKPEAGLKFERRYRYDSHKGVIHFNTTMKVPEGVYENSIPLYTLRSDALRSLLAAAGFSDIAMYGSFNAEPWQPDSYATVVTAVKKG